MLPDCVRVASVDFVSEVMSEPSRGCVVVGRVSVTGSMVCELLDRCWCFCCCFVCLFVALNWENTGFKVGNGFCDDAV